jgi:hypothetical protein
MNLSVAGAQPYPCHFSPCFLVGAKRKSSSTRATLGLNDQELCTKAHLVTVQSQQAPVSSAPSPRTVLGKSDRVLAGASRSVRSTNHRDPPPAHKVRHSSPDRPSRVVFRRHRQRQRDLKPSSETPFMKAPVYDSMSVKPLGIFSLRDKKARRRVLSHAFSQSNAMACVALMQQHLQRLVGVVDQASGEAVDVFLLFRLFALGVVGKSRFRAVQSNRAGSDHPDTGELFLGKPFGALEMEVHNSSKTLTSTSWSAVSDGTSHC